MKEAILVLSNSISGLFTFRREVMKAIADTGYDVYLVGKDDFPKKNDETGCHIVNIEISRRGMNPIADLKLLYTYIQIIKEINPKAVLTYTIKPNIYGGMACRLTKTTQIANITGLGDALENRGWLQKLTVSLYSIGLKKTKKVFFQNNWNLEFFLSHGIIKGESHVLPGSGVNLDYHTYQQYPTKEPLKFLFLGRLIKDKGAREYLNMAKIIGMKYPGVRFDILGKIDDIYKEKFFELEKLGISKYYETTSDIRPYLKVVDCTIMPSYHEGMSNVNLESAANGRPVITTNVPGCRETVEDGKTGFLVTARNTQSLCDAVERFISLPYDQKVLMGKEARNKVEREFNRQIVVDAYLKEINSIK